MCDRLDGKEQRRPNRERESVWTYLYPGEDGIVMHDVMANTFVSIACRVACTSPAQPSPSQKMKSPEVLYKTRDKSRQGFRLD